MPISIPMRKVDYILGEKAEIILTSGIKISGYGDCYVWLPADADSGEDEDVEYLRFVLDNGKEEYLTDEDIDKYKIIA